MATVLNLESFLVMAKMTSGMPDNEKIYCCEKLPIPWQPVLSVGVGFEYLYIYFRQLPWNLRRNDGYTFRRNVTIMFI